ncbi:MAG: antibiotic biosynthesis monooxygenase [Candidatus Methylomirabilales bacterium]
MSEVRVLGGSRKDWFKRRASDLGELPRRALVGTAYWAGYVSTNWNLGRNRVRRSLPPALGVIDGDPPAVERAGTAACITILTVQPWASDLLVERFLIGYAAELQSADGFRQAILARDQSNPDLYVAMTLWDSPGQAQAAPELPEDMQHFVLIRSKLLEVVGRRFRSTWDGIDRRRKERRAGVDRRQVAAVN